MEQDNTCPDRLGQVLGHAKRFSRVRGKIGRDKNLTKEIHYSFSEFVGF